MKISHMCVDEICLPLGRLMVMGFLTKRILCDAAPAITKTDVAPVSAIVCVGSMHIAFARCGTVVVQLEATTGMSSSSSLILLWDDMHT